MNQQEHSMQYSLIVCFEIQDWKSVIEILKERYYDCCQHEDDALTLLESSSTYYYREQNAYRRQEEEEEAEELGDIFENFLFRVDELLRNDHMLEETAIQIMQLFLSLLTVTSPYLSYVASTENSNAFIDADADEGSYQYSPTHKSNTEGAMTATTPLIHHLCIENKHIALALLLRTLDPSVASSEVQKVAHVIFDYEEIINSTTTSAGHTQSVYRNLNVYHTPLQAAWAGTLLDEKRFGNLDKIHHYDDLTDVQADLWKTTVYLLLAFDGKPISLDFASGGDFNILPVISRYGFRCYDAVMMMALRLYPGLAQSAAAAGASHTIEAEDGRNDCDDCCDPDLDVADRSCEFPLHEACKHQICYRPAAAAVTAPNKVDVPVATEVIEGTETEGGDNNPHHSPHLSFNRTSGLPVRCVHFPAIMVLKQYQSVAFRLDTNGRLPLHLALMYHRRNQEKLAAIATKKSGEKDDNSEDSSIYEEEGSAAGGVDDDYIIYSVPLIKALVQTNPKALEHTEPSTGLYPFLLAASNDTSSTLDMVFFLVYSNPNVVANNALLFLGRKMEPSS